MRILAFALLGFLTASTGYAADVDKLVITCLDRQEVSNDDIYVKVVVDGNEITFADSDQRGTSRNNVSKMPTGGELILNEDTRKKLTFSNSIEVKVWERDESPNPDENFGKVEFKANDSDDKSFEGGSGLRKWKYKVTWKTTP